MPAHPPPFQRFFDQHRDAVLALLRGLVGPHDAEDCAQEAFLAALRAYQRFDGRNPRAWVLTIARRKAIDHGRARARRPVPVADVEAVGGGGRGGGGHDAAVFDAVATLPEGQRAAVLLRFAVDLRYREVGQVLGCSEAAARQRVREGLHKLRDGAEEEVTA